MATPSRMGLESIVEEAQLALEKNELAMAFDRLISLAFTLRQQERDAALTLVTDRTVASSSTAQSSRSNRTSGSAESANIMREILDTFDRRIAALETSTSPVSRFDKPLLLAKQVEVIRGERKILSSIDCELYSGEIIGIVGLNGAGKTHLLEVLASEYMPTNGIVVYPGLLTELNHQPLVLDSLSFVPQRLPQFPLSLSSHLELFLALRGVGEHDASTDISIAAAFLGVGHLLERKSSEMSGGELARCSLVRTLLTRPRILLLDEPLAPLDVPSRQIYLRRVRDLVQSSAGIAAVISSHDVRSIESVATRLILVDAGRIAFDGSRDELRATTGTQIDILTLARLPAVLRAVDSHVDLVKISDVLGGFRLHIAHAYELREIVEHLVGAGVPFNGCVDVSGSTELLLEGLR